MDAKAIELASTLVAKLEHVSYDETRRGVFKTLWGQALFSTCIKRMMDQDAPPFNIDEWYAQVLSSKKGGCAKTKYDIAPAVFSQTVDTNWLSSLFELEIKTPGFMLLLHNVLELEDKTHSKLAGQSKEETQYDFLGLGARNEPLRLSYDPEKQKKQALLKDSASFRK